MLELDPTNGALRRSYPIPTTSDLFASVSGLTSIGGGVLLGASANHHTIVAFDKSSGAQLFAFAAPGSGDPRGLAFDGTHLFVADQASNTIFVMAIPEPSTALLMGFGLVALVVRRSR